MRLNISHFQWAEPGALCFWRGEASKLRLKRGNKRAKLDPIGLPAFEVAKLQPRVSAAHIHLVKITHTSPEHDMHLHICPFQM